MEMGSLSRHSTLEVVPDSEEERIQAKMRAREAQRLCCSSEDEKDDNFFAPKALRKPLNISNGSNGASKGSRAAPRVKPPVETIVLSSDTEEEVLEMPKVPRYTVPRRQLHATTKAVDFSPSADKKRKHIAPVSQARARVETIYLSDTESDSRSNHRNRSPPKMRAVAAENDGENRPDGSIIDFVPAPRKAFPLFPNGVAKGEGSNAIVKRKFKRRLTPLPPDPIPNANNDVDEGLSWEHDQDPSGAIQAGAIMLRPDSPAEVDAEAEADIDLTPAPPTKATPHRNAGPSKVNRVAAVIEEAIVSTPGTPGTPASPNVGGTPTKKPAKPKAMPAGLATLHRMAVPFFKELDETVFNRELGAVFLPDPPPLIEADAMVKRKRGVPDPSAIYGMNFKGDYPNENGSFELAWSNKMATTAGRSEFKRTGQGVVTIRVNLGVKVVTNEERLRNTIAHEACHVASWAISNVFDAPHGTTFKSWAKKVEDKFPDIHITTKHGYEIDYKFSWLCSKAGCGQMYHRHTNSIDITKRGCRCGSVLTPQFELPIKRKRKQAGDTPKTAHNASSKPRDSPVPLDIMRGRQGFPSSTSSLSANVNSDKSADEETDSDDTDDIEDLTSAMKYVAI